ncbi:hypothetical protein [Actinomadura fibrosa]|uniref:DUF4190 domain-containing protein n=1 Tax=Actinomadura fibrosa TaxID=111802 RepID=A0ABW2XBD1_9ACTN|nr:hypothetical protein [Actinomadura fibrosa]
MFAGLLFAMIGIPFLIGGIVVTVRLKRKKKSVSTSTGFIMGGLIFTVVGGVSMAIPGESEGVSGDEPTIECTATVLDLDDTHVMVNKETIYKIRARVLPVRGAPLDVKFRERLDARELRAARKHRQFACVQAASDPERVKIKWKSPR